MSFFRRLKKSAAPEPERAEAPTPVASSRARGFVLPPPRQSSPPSSDPRVDRLEQRKAALVAAIDAVEQSADPESPYQQRLQVLDQTLTSIESEINGATQLPFRELPTLPATPIDNLEVTIEPVPVVRFSIGHVRFEYAEEIDWAERGTQIVRGDLAPIAGDAASILPASIPDDLRGEFSAHLDRSLFAFATELRDMAVEGEALPTDPSLADLARICARSGDWLLYGGTCLRCIEHDSELRRLTAERARILQERTDEIENRQRQVEELPIQRRRLAQTIAEIEALESTGSRP